MTTRERIVGALGAVDGLTVLPQAPDTITAGMAWPVWAGSRFLNMVPEGPTVEEWRVFVALANASNEAVTEVDPLIEPVARALMAVGLMVAAVEPAQAPATEGGAGIPLLRFTIRD